MCGRTRFGSVRQKRLIESTCSTGVPSERVCSPVISCAQHAGMKSTCEHSKSQRQHKIIKRERSAGKATKPHCLPLPHLTSTPSFAAMRRQAVESAQNRAAPNAPSRMPTTCPYSTTGRDRARPSSTTAGIKQCSCGRAAGITCRRSHPCGAARCAPARPTTCWPSRRIAGASAGRSAARCGPCRVRACCRLAFPEYRPARSSPRARRCRR